MSTVEHQYPGRPVTTGAGPAWWTRTIADRDAHYGLRVDDTVTAVCGLMFTPLDNPYTHEVVGLGQPSDPEHACRRCAEIAPRDSL